MDDQGDLSRSDMRDIRAALRNEWPIPPPVKQRLLQRLIDYCDRDSPDGERAKPRTVIMAMRTIGAFMALNDRQQRLDLAREKIEAGRTSEGTLADCVAQAEALAERREIERADEGRDDRGR